MRVILISGKAGHGKDTFAGYLKDALRSRGNSVLIAHYADLVKYVCRTFFEWDGNKDMYGRSLLQYVGTDRVREYDPNFWVRFLSEILQIFSDEWDYVLIPDTRFKNEIDNMVYAGLDVVHIRVVSDTRPSSLTDEQSKHPSETALDLVTPDAVIENNGSLDELGKKARDMCETIEKLYEEKHA